MDHVPQPAPAASDAHGRDASLGAVAQTALGAARPVDVARAAVAAVDDASPGAAAVVAEVRGGTLVALAATPGRNGFVGAALAPGAPATTAAHGRGGTLVVSDLPAALRRLGHEHAVVASGAGASGPVAVVAVHTAEPPGDDAARLVQALATLVAETIRRDRHDEELRSSEARYRALVEHAPICIHEIDGDARITAANEMATQLLAGGADPVGSSYLAAIAAADRPAVAMRLSQALEGVSEPFEFRAAAADRVFEARFIPLPDRDGGVSRLIGATQDVTEQRRSLEALAKSEQRFRRLFDSRRDLIALIGLDGRFVAVNATFAELLGYDQDELVGRALAETMPPGSGDVPRAAIEAMLAAGEESTTYEIEQVTIDGTRYPVEVTAQLVHEGGRPVILAVGRDLSERVELEAQLRQAQKLEAIGRLTGGIAHDFNNLLTAIEGYAELALRRPGGDTTHYVEGILAAAQRAAKLTDQLMTFSRRRPLDARPIDLRAVVEQVEDMLRRLLGEDVELRVETAPDAVVVHGDAGSLEQVLVNLAVNARDAMPRGGTLTIETAVVELDSAYASRRVGVRPGTYALLAVSDTGIGIDRETRQRLFEPFFTTKPTGQGTGLGLATVHGIVEQAGGAIHVYSEPGQGTTFKLYFPVAQGSPATPEPPPPEPQRAAGERILLVEDDETVRRLAQRMLSELGYEVLTASSRTDAAELARTAGEIRLALSDVVLPDGSGVGLARELSDALPGLRWLFMSGYGDHALVHRGELPPDAAFIGKPFSVDALAAKVRQVLDAR